MLIILGPLLDHWVTEKGSNTLKSASQFGAATILSAFACFLLVMRTCDALKRVGLPREHGSSSMLTNQRQAPMPRALFDWPYVETLSHPVDTTLLEIG